MLALSIAGFDPTGGAGVLNDVKVLNLLGIKSAGIPTTLTLQNTSVFKGWEPVNPDYLKSSLELIFSDLPVKGIKIGMIGTSENAEIIGYFLKKYRNKISWIVLDPVLQASLNYPLFSSKEEYLNILKTKIFPYVDVITPNVFEASVLTEKIPKKKKDLLELCKILISFGIKVIIITGWESELFTWDFFCEKDKAFFFKKKKLKGNFHGTGCAFSSAILGFLLKGFSCKEAFKKAKNWLYLYLKKSTKEKIGGNLWLFL